MLEKQLRTNPHGRTVETQQHDPRFCCDLLTEREFHVAFRFPIFAVHHALDELAHLGDRHGDGEGIAVLAGLDTQKNSGQKIKDIVLDGAPLIYCTICNGRTRIQSLLLTSLTMFSSVSIVVVGCFCLL